MLDFLKPGVLSRRLIKMAMNTNEAVQRIPRFLVNNFNLF